MDWLNLHTSVLDSPEFLRCEPVRRAAWLMLLRYCVGQENGGRIVGCRAWGDTTWQQLCRVKLREVRAESPLWAWDGDDLTVTFYPSEKEAEVQAKREVARSNGRSGGRPKKTNVGLISEPRIEPTSVESVKTEGNGKERNGMEGKEAAAQPLAREKTQPPPPADPMFDGEAPPRKIQVAQDWFIWRQQHERLYVGKSDEDGNLASWQSLFNRAGIEVMSAMYAALLPTIPIKHRIGYSAALAWIATNAVDD